MQTFTRDGLTFDVTDESPADGSGNGETIVLLHGFPQSRREWDAMVPLLVERGYRVLAPDQRGYSPGARPTGRKAYTYSQLVGDAVALLDAAGVDQAHVVGHDWGALVAWALASKHPERVRTLVTLSVPHPRAFLGAMRRGQALKSWYMLFFQLPGVPERVLPTSVGLGLVAGKGFDEDQVADYLRELGPAGLTGSLNWYRALPWSQRETGYGRNTTVPTTFVWGAHDPALGRAGAEATGSYVDADYRFVELLDSGHWIVDEDPQRIADIVVERATGRA